MPKHLPTLAKIALLCFVTATPASAAVNVSVTIIGMDDATTTLRVSDGTHTAWSSTGTPGIEYGPAVFNPSGEPDEITGTVPGDWSQPELYRWTSYSFTVGDHWVGKAVCFSLDGESWTGLHLVMGATDLTFQTWEVGGSPYEGTPAVPTENISPLGNTLLLGKWWNYPDLPVFTQTVWDNAFEPWPCVGLDSVAHGPHAYWRWMRGGTIAMELDYLHRLTLATAHSGQRRIVLDPELGRISIDGQPVLTRNSGGLNLALGGTVATQPSAKPQPVLGSYNVTAAPPAGSSPAHDQRNGVLIVGSGMGATAAQRANGLRILEDGTVLIQPKGDIQMQFTAGPRP